jgi:hypothetical protein
MPDKRTFHGLTDVNARRVWADEHVVAQTHLQALAHGLEEIILELRLDDAIRPLDAPRVAQRQEIALPGGLCLSVLLVVLQVGLLAGKVLQNVGVVVGEAECLVGLGCELEPGNQPEDLLHQAACLSECQLPGCLPAWLPGCLAASCLAGVLTCLTPSSRPHVLKVGRILTGKECLLVQGFPKSFFGDARIEECATDAGLRDLAGNSFCSNSFLATLIAALSFMPPAKANAVTTPTTTTTTVSQQHSSDSVMSLLDL